MGERRDGRLALASALALVLVTAGCASIPTSGPVQRGEPVRYAPEDSFIRVLAPPPQPGAEPREVLRGFLRASADFGNGHETARRFLHESVRRGWRPGAGVTVLDRESYGLSDVVGEGERLVLRSRAVGSVDARGRYTPLPQPRTIEVPFPLRRDDSGEWRIAAPPDGLYLARPDFDRAFRRLNLYFLAPGRDQLVPEPVALPAGPGLATALTAGLLAGPAPELGAAVTNAFPPGTGLAVGAVPVEDGVARVDLTAPALRADPPARQAFSAQLAWTLRQLGEVRAVRVAVEGAPLEVPGRPGQPQPVQAWSAYDPAGLPPGAPAYLVSDGRVGTLVGSRFVPLPGPPGEGRIPLRAPAVSLNGDRLAALSLDANRLYTSRLTGQAGAAASGSPGGAGGAAGGPPGAERQDAAGNAPEKLARRLRGRDFSPPSYDSSGTLWVLERGRGPGAVWALPPEGHEDRVELPTPAGASVSLLQVARDGARVAVVLRLGGRDELHLGAVVRDVGRLRVQLLRRIAPELVEVRELAWRDESRLAVLAREREGVLRPYLVAADGLAVEELSTLAEQPVGIAAAPGDAPLLLGARDGRVYEASGRTWTGRGRGTDPTYPG